MSSDFVPVGFGSKLSHPACQNREGQLLQHCISFPNTSSIKLSTSIVSSGTMLYIHMV